MVYSEIVAPTISVLNLHVFELFSSAFIIQRILSSFHVDLERAHLVPPICTLAVVCQCVVTFVHCPSSADCVICSLVRVCQSVVSCDLSGVLALIRFLLG